MKIPPLVLLIACGAIASPHLATLEAFAGASAYTCVTLRGVPTTTAVMTSGKSVPVIRWVSDVFTGSGWSPQRRCTEVSDRFTKLNNQGLLNYLTTGYLNGMNVICAAINKNDVCTGDNLLFTLKPNQSAPDTLKRLFNVRTYAVRPLNETGDQVFVDLNEFLGLGSSTGISSPSAGDALIKWSFP